MAKKQSEPGTDRIVIPTDMKPTPAVTPANRTGLGKGWKKDPHDPRDLTTKHLFGARRGAAPTEASLEEFVIGIRDQGQTSSCVGQALARAVDVRLRKVGTPLPVYPSAQAIYTVARDLDKLSKTEAIADEGSQPRQAMKGIKEYGVPNERVWPFDEGKINSELPWDVLQAGSCFLLSAYYRIDTLGHERVLDVCQALASGFPIVLGVDVDDAFEALSGPTPLLAPTKSLGGHMLCLVGFKTLANGQRLFRGVNSWSTGWGDKGMFWATEAWLTDPGAGDLYVIQASGA